MRLVSATAPAADDTYAKAAAAIGEHIPDKPTVIAQNMPGAGSRNAPSGEELQKIGDPDRQPVAADDREGQGGDQTPRLQVRPGAKKDVEPKE